MNDQAKDASGGIRQIDPLETVTRAELEGLVKNNEILANQVELLGGMLRLALPLMGGPMIFTRDILGEQIDTLNIQIHKAKDVIPPRDCFDFGLQLGIDMSLAFVAIVTPKPEQEAFKLKLAREARKATDQLTQKKG